jgi:AcrR family transcriptional regulator
MTIDRRVNRTRTALYDAIVALMREKPYGEIGVQDILGRADVGRSTFYAHFRSKDELLARSLERLRPIFEAGRLAQQQKPRVESCESTLALFRHVREYRDLLAAAEGSPARTIIVETIEAELARFLSPFTVVRSNDMPRKLALRFVTGTFVAVMSWWLDRNPDLSAEEVDRFFHRLVEHGTPKGFFSATPQRHAA